MPFKYVLTNCFVVPFPPPRIPLAPRCRSQNSCWQLRSWHGESLASDEAQSRQDIIDRWLATLYHELQPMISPMNITSIAIKIILASWGERVSLEEQVQRTFAMEDERIECQRIEKIFCQRRRELNGFNALKRFLSRIMRLRAAKFESVRRQSVRLRHRTEQSYEEIASNEQQEAHPLYYAVIQELESFQRHEILLLCVVSSYYVAHWGVTTQERMAQNFLLFGRPSTAPQSSILFQLLDVLEGFYRGNLMLRRTNDVSFLLSALHLAESVFSEEDARVCLQSREEEDFENLGRVVHNRVRVAQSREVEHEEAHERFLISRNNQRDLDNVFLFSV